MVANLLIKRMKWGSGIQTRQKSLDLEWSRFLIVGTVAIAKSRRHPGRAKKLFVTRPFCLVK